MFFHFFRFELRYWLRGMMVWVFFVIIGAMFFGAASSDQIIVGSALQNTYRNAPFVVEQFYAMACILTLLMATAFVNSAAARDFQYNTSQIIFSTPLRKLPYLLGHFAGAALISIIPMLGVSAAVILAKYMPWVDAERWGPIHWHAHLNGILVFAIPNTIFVAAIIFTIAALTRSTITSFLGALLLLVAYGIAGAYMSDLNNETVSMLLDPFGIRTFALLTKYWTVADKNNLSLPLTGIMLLNRLIWVAVGLLVLAFACARFRFEERSKKPKQTVESETSLPRAVFEPRSFTPAYGPAAQWAQLLSQIRVEFLSLVKTTTFIVILVAALLNCIPSLILSAKSMYGVSALPVTYNLLDIIRGTLYLFLIAIVTYFAGVLVWKERDARCDEIHDTLPYPNWIPYVAKFFALLAAVVLILLLAMLAAMGVQTWHHYTRYQLGLYLRELFVLDFLGFVFYTFLAFLIHILSPNKYAGYFAYVAFLIANVFVWRPLNVATIMVRFGDMPSYVYSDLYLFAPFIAALTWFAVYWLLFCGLLAIASVLLWPRGRETSFRDRLRNARQNFHGVLRPLTAALLTGWIACAGWVFYNTRVLHELIAEKERDRLSAGYEKTYKKYQSLNQPRIQSVRYAIDIYPAERNLILRGDQVIKNTGDQPISEIHLNYQRSFDTTINIEHAALKQDDKRLNYRIYSLNPPLPPGESLRMKFTVAAISRGFEQSLSHNNLVQNGTFFNNTIAPQIGYQPSRELTDRNDRRKQGLPERDLMPTLERDCTAHCRNTYLSNNSDWVSVDTVISTSPDQIAVAPGSLLREWTANGRRYFHYKLDHDSVNFYSFISARYEVAREEWNGVRIEVYYHPEHKWNVPKMLASIRKTLDYASRNFGPYMYHEARIIEFPRFASFAQAFPGTMPYSESIGFIADLKDPDDIDMVFYVTAHEMGHQWWAHQIIGANMQGATLLSETMAQYTALMVMEKEYGRDLMRKFLAYEMDRYLRSRGRELLKERPLLRVESSQGYIHYQKGSVVLYYLKEMIGEEAINRALHKMIRNWAYHPPPYPTSHHMVDALTEVTPPEYHYLIRDLFEDITLFSNRTLSATAKKRPDGAYDVTIEVESKKLKADEKGAEKEVPVNDWIEIGAFAKPGKGKKYGATLHRERVHITGAKNTFTFTTKEPPEKAGIDPFLLLVDRVPDDNLKKVTTL